MHKSTAGSMFDGLQLFGKTNSNFSLTQSYQPTTKSRTNYQFESDTSVLPPPSEGFASLSHSINDNKYHDRDLPPQNFPTSSGKRNLQPDTVQSHEYKSLPKSWILPDSSDRARTPSKTELVPLSNARFVDNEPSSKGRSSPPPMTNVDSLESSLIQSTESLSINPLDSFFSRLSDDIERFKESVIKLKRDHEVEVEAQKGQIKAIEGSIKATSLISIQELVDAEQRSSKLASIESDLKQALQENDFATAEKLQLQLDNQSTNIPLLIFEMPSDKMKNKESTSLLSKTSKTYVGSLKSFCVSLDECANKFKSITKKIEVRCSSKLDKQRQDLESLTNAITCKEEHLAIDKEYNIKQKQALETENKITVKALSVQIDYQDEMLTEVQEQIKELEEKLNKLKCQEVAILDEKRKLLHEKSSYEKEHQEKLLHLNSETDKLHVKTVSVNHEKSVLRDQQEDYDKNSTKLNNLNQSLDEVKSLLNTFKHDACEIISLEESRIIKEIETDVQLCSLESLQSPSELTDLVTQIISFQEDVDGLSNELFDLQKSLTTLKNKKSLLESNLENCRDLKKEAVTSKKYQEAARLTEEEAIVSSDIHKVSEEIENIKVNVEHKKRSLDKSRSELSNLQSSALSEQRKFDEECYSIISEKLQILLEQLRNLPETETPAKRLLRFDIGYMLWYMKAIKARNPDISMQFSELQESAVKELSGWIDRELGAVQGETDAIKTQISDAISSERFDEAESLNEKFEMLHNKN